MSERISKKDEIENLKFLLAYANNRISQLRKELREAKAEIKRLKR